MNDREIYTEIAKVLLAESPKTEQENHLHLCIWPKEAVDMVLWFSKFRSPESGYALSPDSTVRISDLFQSLYAYFQENELGKWNLAHFILSPNGESFNVDFEFNKDKEAGNLRLWRYREKFNEGNA